MGGYLLLSDRANLWKVKSFLIDSYGMKETVLQLGSLPFFKSKQIFGLVFPLKLQNKVIQVHVRGFENGTLDGELEPFVGYLEHYLPNSYFSNYLFIQHILQQLDIEYRLLPHSKGTSSWLNVQRFTEFSMYPRPLNRFIRRAVKLASLPLILTYVVIYLGNIRYIRLLKESLADQTLSSKMFYALTESGTILTTHLK